MKLIKISMELVIDDDVDCLLSGESTDSMFTPMYDFNKISNYLNKKLYEDPEWFGEFGPENIVSVTNYN